MGYMAVFDPVLGKLRGEKSKGNEHNVIDRYGDINALEVVIDGKRYAVGCEPINAPNDPAFTVTGTAVTVSINDENVSGYKKSAIVTLTSSGATIYYSKSEDGDSPADPTQDNAHKYTQAISLNQNITERYKVVKIKAFAVKNGEKSETIEKTYNIFRQAGTPIIAVESGSTDYDLSRLCTISEKSNNGETLHYATGDANASSSSTQITTGSSIPALVATTRVTAIATKIGWLDSEVAALTINVGKKKCYIGQSASVTTASDVEALTVKSSLSATAVSGYKEDTLHGKIKDVFCGTTENDSQYVWFAIPKDRVAKVNNEYKKLSVKYNANGADYPISIQYGGVGTEIGDYLVWRSADAIFRQYAMIITLK